VHFVHVILSSRPFGTAGTVSSSTALGRRKKNGETLDAWLFEAAIQPNDAWTFFARAEQVDQGELTPAHDICAVRKVSIGAIHDWRLSDDNQPGVGALFNGFDIPRPKSTSYGGAGGAMVFGRIKIG
jgi:hypothetical protein